MSDRAARSLCTRCHTSGGSAVPRSSCARRYPRSTIRSPPPTRARLITTAQTSRSPRPHELIGTATSQIQSSRSQQCLAPCTQRIRSKSSGARLGSVWPASPPGACPHDDQGRSSLSWRLSRYLRVRASKSTKAIEAAGDHDCARRLTGTGLCCLVPNRVPPCSTRPRRPT